MTYREKLAKEHPEAIAPNTRKFCIGCPETYGYSEDSIRNCPFGYPGDDHCYRCWDREIPGIESTIDIQKLYNEQWERMAKIVEEATQKRDRSVSIFFSPETGLSLSVYPWPDVEELERMHRLGRITANQFRRAVGLEPIRETDTKTISER